MKRFTINVANEIMKDGKVICTATSWEEGQEIIEALEYLEIYEDRKKNIQDFINRIYIEGTK